MSATVLNPSVDIVVRKLLSEQLLGMSAAARRLGTFRQDKSTHTSTVTRWAKVGVLLADGTRVRLESIRLNGRIVTSDEALVRFIEAQQSPADDTGPPQTRRERTRAAEQAGDDLSRMGF